MPVRPKETRLNILSTCIPFIAGGHVHRALLLALMSMVPRSQRIYIFFNCTIPKMKISTIKYYFFYITIENVLIDTGSLSNMPVDMSMVPRAHGTMDICLFFLMDF